MTLAILCLLIAAPTFASLGFVVGCVWEHCRLTSPEERACDDLGIEVPSCLN